MIAPGVAQAAALQRRRTKQRRRGRRVAFSWLGVDAGDETGIHGKTVPGRSCLSP